MPSKKSKVNPTPNNRPKPGNHLVVVLPDTHFPYHDPQALEVALQTIEVLKPQKVVLLGDFIDASSFSAHPSKSLVEAKVKDFEKTELDPANEALDRIQANTNETHYIEGNHEARVERSAAQMGGQLLSVYSMISPQVNLSKGRENFNWISYNSSLPHYRIARDLIAFHGMSVSKHAQAVNLTKLRSCSGISGHTHRQQMDTGRDPWSERALKTWSPGCLSVFQPFYMHHNPSDWLHGIDLIYVKDDLSEWTNFTLTISKGETILPSGKSIKL